MIRLNRCVSLLLRKRRVFKASRTGAITLAFLLTASPALSQQAGETARVLLNSYVSTQIKGTARFLMPSDNLGMPKGTAILSTYSVGPGPFDACVFRIIKPDGASIYFGDRCLAKIAPLPETRISQYPREVQIDGGQILLMTWGE
jgi:hypothetical protein